MAQASMARKRRAGRPFSWLLGSCLALLGTGAPPLAAQAAVQISQKRILPYPYDPVWSTSVRYLRVDRGYTVTDADAEAGYILFEFAVGSQERGTGSLEAFATTDASGRPSVAVTVTTGAGPVHLPHTILDGLASKIRAERGQPAPPPSAPPAPEKPPKSPEPPPEAPVQ